MANISISISIIVIIMIFTKVCKTPCIAPGERHEKAAFLQCISHSLVNSTVPGTSCPYCL